MLVLALKFSSDRRQKAPPTSGALLGRQSGTRQRAQKTEQRDSSKLHGLGLRPSFLAVPTGHGAFRRQPCRPVINVGVSDQGMVGQLTP